MLAPWKKSYDQPRQHIKKKRHYFANKGPSSQIYGFSSSHVWMWDLDHKESWAPKNWCFWKRLFGSPCSPQDSQESSPKASLLWRSDFIFIVQLSHPYMTTWKTIGLTRWTFAGKVMSLLFKDWYWSWNSNTLATWCEELTHWKRPWCWERSKAGG